MSKPSELERVGRDAGPGRRACSAAPARGELDHVAAGQAVRGCRADGGLAFVTAVTVMFDPKVVATENRVPVGTAAMIPFKKCKTRPMAGLGCP